MIDLMVKSVFQYFRIASTCSQNDKVCAFQECLFNAVIKNQKSNTKLVLWGLYWKKVLLSCD